MSKSNKKKIVVKSKSSSKKTTAKKVQVNRVGEKVGVFRRLGNKLVGAATAVKTAVVKATTAVFSFRPVKAVSRVIAGLIDRVLSPAKAVHAAVVNRGDERAAENAGFSVATSAGDLGVLLFVATVGVWLALPYAAWLAPAAPHVLHTALWAGGLLTFAWKGDTLFATVLRKTADAGHATLEWLKGRPIVERISRVIEAWGKPFMGEPNAKAVLVASVISLIGVAGCIGVLLGALPTLYSGAWLIAAFALAGYLYAGRAFVTLAATAVAGVCWTPEKAENAAKAIVGVIRPTAVAA